MKRTILLLLTLFVQLGFFAQENNYMPFAEEGKVWNMYYHNDLNHLLYPTYYYHFFIEGDTLIAGKSSKKLYAFNENNDNQTEYKMALFESVGKVYFIPKGSTESYILYDFQMSKGTSTIIADPIHPESEIEMRNNKSVVAKINDVSRRCSYVNRINANFEDYPSGWWIEGIGSELGPLNTWGFGADGNYRFFQSCEMNGEIVFDTSDLLNTRKEEYYTEGTKWTEIRLDTLKYESWYSKVNGEWVPNFETIEYYVQGEYLERYDDVPLKCVYTNGPTWTDSLSLLVRERMYENTVEVNVPLFYEDNWGSLLKFPCSAEIYQFDWSVGKGLYYRDIDESNSTGIVPYYFFYGVIDEIKEAYFGGVKPLKYVDLDGKAAKFDFGYCIDTRGGRIIQGIGITEWNDGECIFGPIRPYEVLSALGAVEDEQRHYRSMLVHFERDGEVLYDVWPEKPVASEPVTFTAGQMATIVLPTEPDASKGKYYRLDRVDGNEIVFEQETQPRAHVPYIIVPNEDFSIKLSTLELAGLRSDTVSIEGISFIGSFVREVIEEPEGFYIDIIDRTPDCSFENDKQMIGTLRAYLLVTWDDPYNHGGTKVPAEKMQIVLHNTGTGLKTLSNSPLKGENIYDLSGRRLSNSKLPRGIYIKDGRKQLQ